MATLRETFRQHHRLTDAERADLWENCIFVPDTNVLLNIYRYADSTREDLFRVFEKLRARLWIPYQVAHEFYQRRISVISEQKKKWTELEGSLDRAVTTLKGGSFQKSAFLNLGEVEAVLQPAIDQAKALVSAKKAAHPDLIQDDPYLEQLAELIGDAFGSAPVAADLDNLHKACQERIDNQQPPGFSDHKKDPPERYGDVLIWFELLKYAEATAKPIVFITDDEKEDWWQIVEGKKLGPRPELRAEMRSRAGVDFYIYRPAYILESAEKELDVPVASSSIDDAKSIAEELHETGDNRPSSISVPARVTTTRYYNFLAHVSGHYAEDAVRRWLTATLQEAEIRQVDEGLFDFIVSQREDTLGVIVKTLRVPQSPRTRTQIIEIYLRAYGEISDGKVDDLRLFLVCSTEDSVQELVRSFSRINGMKPRYWTSIGVLQEDGTYREIVNDVWKIIPPYAHSERN
jgi:hypothetical protein